MKRNATKHNSHLCRSRPIRARFQPILWLSTSVFAPMSSWPRRLAWILALLVGRWFKVIPYTTYSMQTCNVWYNIIFCVFLFFNWIWQYIVRRRDGMWFGLNMLILLFSSTLMLASRAKSRFLASFISIVTPPSQTYFVQYFNFTPPPQEPLRSTSNNAPQMPTFTPPETAAKPLIWSPESHASFLSARPQTNRSARIQKMGY